MGTTNCINNLTKLLANYHIDMFPKKRLFFRYKMYKPKIVNHILQESKPVCHELASRTEFLPITNCS